MPCFDGRNDAGTGRMDEDCSKLWKCVHEHTEQAVQERAGGSECYRGVPSKSLAWGCKKMGGSDTSIT